MTAHDWVNGWCRGCGQHESAMNLTGECSLELEAARQLAVQPNAQSRPPVTAESQPRHPLELLDLLIRANAAAQHPGEEHEDLAEQFTQVMADPATGEQLRALRAQAEAEDHADRTPSDASTCPCANCGTVWSRAEEHRFGEMYDGEWVCSKACEDEHNALGCPFEQGDSYRIPFRDRAQMETERRLREALRTLCDLNDNPPPPDQRGVLATIAWTNARAALAQAGGE